MRPLKENRFLLLRIKNPSSSKKEDGKISRGATSVYRGFTAGGLAGCFRFGTERPLRCNGRILPGAAYWKHSLRLVRSYREVFEFCPFSRLSPAGASL